MRQQLILPTGFEREGDEVLPDGDSDSDTDVGSVETTMGTVVRLVVKSVPADAFDTHMAETLPSGR